MRRRKISDYNADMSTELVIGAAKIGTVFLTCLNQGPEAALGSAFIAEAGGILLQSHKARISALMQVTTEKVLQLPAEFQERFRANVETEEGERIIETAWNQAASSVDPEKLTYIAALLKNSLSSSDLQTHQTRWLLRLLDEIDDVQLLILQSHTSQHQTDQSFRDRHEAIFNDAQRPELGRRQHPRYAEDPTTDEERMQRQEERRKSEEQWQAKKQDYEIARERHALYQSRVHHLAEMGLLGAKVEDDRVIFDSVEFGKVSQTLTPLGAALLKIIDATSDTEWGYGEQINPIEALQQSKAAIANYAHKSDEIEEKIIRRIQ